MVGDLSKRRKTKSEAPAAERGEVSVAHAAYGFLGMHSAAFGVGEIPAYQAWQLYESISTLAKCVDLIADQVSMIEPMFLFDGEPEDGSKTELLFRRPGFNRNRKSLIKSLVIQRIVTGNAYLSVLGNRSYEPISLDVCKSMYISPIQGHDMWPAQYIYSEGTRSQFFTKEGSRDYRWVDRQGLTEIIPIYSTDGIHRGVGTSMLQAIRLDIETRLRGTEHNISMLNNGARIGGMISFADRLPKDAKNDIVRQFEVGFSGSANSGKTLVTDGGKFDFKPMSQTVKDMDWTNLIKIVDDAIISRLNIPLALYNTTAQTDNNYEMASHMFYDVVVIPEFEVIWSPIAAMLSNRIGREVTITPNVLKNNVLFKQAANRARDLHGSRLISTNEARKLIGHEEIIGGDDLVGDQGGESLIGDGVLDDTASSSHASDRSSRTSDHTTRDKAR